MQQYSEGVNKNFTVGDLKKLLNKFPEDTIICRTRIKKNYEQEYTSIQSLTYGRKQDFIDFMGDIQEGNILTIF